MQQSDLPSYSITNQLGTASGIDLDFLSTQLQVYRCSVNVYNKQFITILYFFFIVVGAFIRKTTHRPLPSRHLLIAMSIPYGTSRNTSLFQQKKKHDRNVVNYRKSIR